MAEQNFENHTKIVPLFHIYVLGVLALNFLWSLYHWKMTEFSLDGLVSILLASALMLLAFFARIFALTVQDRHPPGRAIALRAPASGRSSATYR